MMRRLRNIVAGAAALVVIGGATPSQAGQVQQCTHGIYGFWWSLGAVWGVGVEQGFFPGLNISTVPGGGASLSALAKGPDAESGACSINTYEYALHGCPVGGECTLAAIVSDGTHPYEMVGSSADHLRTEGSVSNVLRDVKIAVSDCRQGHRVVSRADVLDGANRYTADGLMMLWVVRQNAQLKKAGLPLTAFYCGTPEAYAEAHQDIPGDRVVYAYPYSDSPHRLLALGKGEVDMALLAMSVASKARVVDGFVDAFDQSLLPRLPAAGITMQTSFLESARGAAHLSALCSGLKRTNAFISEDANKPAVYRYLREAFSWKGDVFESELERVRQYLIKNVTGACVVSHEVMMDAAEFVGGRSYEAISISSTVHSTN